MTYHDTCLRCGTPGAAHVTHVCVPSATQPEVAPKKLLGDGEHAFPKRRGGSHEARTLGERLRTEASFYLPSNNPDRAALLREAASRLEAAEQEVEAAIDAHEETCIARDDALARCSLLTEALEEIIAETAFAAHDIARAALAAVSETSKQAGENE